MSLTSRQREILDFIDRFIEEYRFSPSYEEIASHFGYRSLSTVHDHVQQLKRRGYVAQESGCARTLEIKKK